MAEEIVRDLVRELVYSLIDTPREPRELESRARRVPCRAELEGVGEFEIAG
jgi:hypothetical protein